ncbi:MAG: type II toxin-antitoxin system HicB family antitoxin [Gemmatimonadaceae bacterium]
MLGHRGYAGLVEYDDEARLFHGEVVGTRAVLTFQGTTVDEIEQAFRDTVDEYLVWCAERGKEPEKPYSGRFVVRASADLHRAAAAAAARSGQSLNAWVVQAIERAAS